MERLVLTELGRFTYEEQRSGLKIARSELISPSGIKVIGFFSFSELFLPNLDIPFKDAKYKKDCLNNIKKLETTNTSKAYRKLGVTFRNNSSGPISKLLNYSSYYTRNFDDPEGEWLGLTIYAKDPGEPCGLLRFINLLGYEKWIVKIEDKER